MQPANDTAAQLQATAQTTTNPATSAATAAAVSTVSVTATATASTAASNLPNSALSISSIIATDIKEEHELSKKETPLPKNPGYEWVMTGDMNLLDSEQNGGLNYITYEKKIIEDKNNNSKENVPASATAAQTPADTKTIQEKKPLVLSHVVIGNFRSYNFNPNLGQHLECQIKPRPICILLFFKDMDEQTQELLKYEIIYKIHDLLALIPKIDIWLEPMDKNKFLNFGVGYHYKEVLDEFFEAWMDKGIFSKIDADYFKKICGHRAIPYFEKQGMENIKKLLNKNEYDKVIQELEIIQDESIRESQTHGIYSMILDKQSQKPIYFNPSASAYTVGRQLLKRSALHALKAFNLLKLGSPHYSRRLGLALSFAELHQNIDKLSPNTRRELIQFIFNSMMGGSAGREMILAGAVGKAINLLIELLDIHARGHGDGIKLLQPIKDLVKLSDLEAVWSNNVIALANQIYTLNQLKKNANLKTNHDESQINFNNLNKQSQEKPDTSTTLNSTAMTASAASNTQTTTASAVLAPSTVTTLDLKTPKDLVSPTPCPMPNLPENWKLNANSDWQKFLEDKTNHEVIILERILTAPATTTSEKDAKNSKDQSEGQKASVPPFAEMMIVRLKHTELNLISKTKREDEKPTFNLILLAPDPVLEHRDVYRFPRAVLTHLFQEDQKYKTLNFFNSYGDIVGNTTLSKLMKGSAGKWMISFKIGLMRETMVEKMMTVLQKCFSENEVLFIRDLIRPFIKLTSAKELELTKHIHRKTLEALGCNRMLKDLKNRGEKNPELENNLNKHRNAALNTAIQHAKTIHAWTIAENKTNGFFKDSLRSYCLDDTEVALNLAREIALISSEHAYEALEIISTGSLYFDEAQELMAPIAIELATNMALPETKRRQLREKALKHLMEDDKNDCDILLQFLEVHMGYETVGSGGLFANLKYKDRKFDVRTAGEVALILCETLADLKNKLRPTASATRSSMTPPIITISAAHATAAAAATLTVYPSTITFSGTGTAAASATITQNKPSNTAASAATSVANLEQMAETGSKRIKSLDESDSDDEVASKGMNTHT